MLLLWGQDGAVLSVPGCSMDGVMGSERAKAGEQRLCYGVGGGDVGEWRSHGVRARHQWWLWPQLEVRVGAPDKAATCPLLPTTLVFNSKTRVFFLPM